MFFAIAAITCYWIAIGMFLASLFCLVRLGVIKRVLGDRTCRRTLFVGAGGGVCIAGLNLLALVNRWTELQGFFKTPDLPVASLLEAAAEYSYLPADRTARLIWWMVAIVVYWFALGLLFGFLLCVFKNREAQVRVSGE